MPALKDVYEELQFVSDRISTQVRSQAAAVIALVWLFLVGGKDAPSVPVSPSRPWLLAAAGLAIAALLTDYLHYLAGYASTLTALREAEASKASNVTYDYASVAYRLRTFFFWAKQIIVVCAVAATGYQIIRCLLG